MDSNKVGNDNHISFGMMQSTPSSSTHHGDFNLSKTGDAYGMEELDQVRFMYRDDQYLSENSGTSRPYTMNIFPSQTDTSKGNTSMEISEPKRACNACNHFHRLPDELTVSIFDKIDDLKCLFHCSLVSKHFASLVPLVRTVSVTIPDYGTYTKKSHDRLSILLLELQDQNYNAEQIGTLLDELSLEYMKLPVFLDKFTGLKCISLDYHYTVKNANSFMRKIKFRENGTNIESFVALESLYMYKDTANEAGQEQDIGQMIEMFHRVKISWWLMRVRYLEWICYAMMLVKCHASLKRVTITDSELNGKMVIEDVRLKLGVLVELWNQLSAYIVRSACVPMMHLPLSGYVMTWVAVMIVDNLENPGARAKELDEIQFWDFDDELPVFREAVKEIMKNHKETLRILA